MIALAAAGLIALQAVDVAGAPAPEPVIALDWAAPRLDQRLIRQAVRDTLAAERDSVPARRYEVDSVRATASAVLTAAMDEARVPDCLHADGLKRQPTNIGPIGVSGLLALPFVAIAKLRGKCN